MLKYSSDKYYPYDSIRPRYCLSQQSCNAWVTGIKLTNISFDTLRLVINNEETYLDGPGYTFIISDSSGFICTMSYSPWVSSKAQGWVILKN